MASALTLAMAGALSATPAFGATFVFPSTASSVFGNGGAPANEIGYFWSAARGDRVTQTFAATKNITRAILKVQTPTNGSSVAVTWRLEINGSNIGTFVVPANTAGAKQSLDVSFPAITGPFYTVTIRVLTEVPNGQGAHTFGVGPGVDHSLELVDLVAPTTTLGAGGPADVADTGDATFAFSSAATDVSKFDCSLDGGAYAVCTSPKAYTGLASGDHKFSVRGTDDAGNTATPTTRTWKVDPPPVCADESATVQHGTVATLTLPCTDGDGDPLTTSLITPPTIGNLGAIDQATQKLAFAAPQGSSGTTTFTYRSSAEGRVSEIGTFTVTVLGPPTASVLPGVDADKDGFFAGQDCNDANAAIRPGALEVRGNNLDENCDGLAEPFPTLTSGVGNKWSVTGTKFTLTLLQVTQQFPKGLKVKILCKGSKCPFKSKSLKAGKVKKGAATIITSLTKKQRKFRAGQTVEVWVSAPSFNTKVARFVLRKGKIPTTEPFCVLPGQSKPQKSCS